VSVDGQWIPVPSEAVIEQANPLDEAVVWYTKFGGRVFIRCFVSGAEG
jgi:hypothetical protein